MPVVHACSVLAAPPEPGSCPEGGYVRRVTELDYDVVWVELLECDGVAPYGGCDGLNSYANCESDVSIMEAGGLLRDR